MAVDVPKGEGLVDIAREAYAFFFPMLMGYRFLFGVNLAPGLPSYVAPVNTLDGRPETVDHTSEDVITPNSDTPYSIANLDLRAEPMVLSVPEITDRFYHFQMEDLWGHNPLHRCQHHRHRVWLLPPRRSRLERRDTGGHRGGIPVRNKCRLHDRPHPTIRSRGR